MASEVEPPFVPNAEKQRVAPLRFAPVAMTSCWEFGYTNKETALNAREVTLPRQTANLQIDGAPRSPASANVGWSLSSSDASVLRRFRPVRNKPRKCHPERSRGPRRRPLLPLLGWRSEGSAFFALQVKAGSSLPFGRSEY